MARIGGQFPFPIAQVAEGGTRISLASGGVYTLPANQYLVITDANSVLQYWDPQKTEWTTLYGHNAAGDVTADGCNYRLFNDSGTLGLGALTVANGTAAGLTNGIGAASGVSIAFTGVAGFPTATAYAIVGGAVAAPTVTQTGSGFTAPPLIIIDPPPVGGIQAQAVATVTAGGGINAVTVTVPGAGYQASPNFWIAPQTAGYTGGVSGAGSFPAAPFPPGGIVAQANALPGNQNIGTGTAGALLTPVALTGSGTITGAVKVVWGGGTGAGAMASTLTNAGAGALGTAAISGTATAPANATVILSPRVVQ
jgi:hypothetical protein